MSRWLTRALASREREDPCAAMPLVPKKKGREPFGTNSTNGTASRSVQAPLCIDREDWDAYFDERAGIMEFDGGLDRQEAEGRAFGETFEVLGAKPTVH